MKTKGTGEKEKRCSYLGGGGGGGGRGRQLGTQEPKAKVEQTRSENVD